MTVLGIDPSTTSLGYAFYVDGMPAIDGYFEPERTSPRHTLQAIEEFLEGMLKKKFVDTVACERMFQGPFMGERSAVLKAIPEQIAYVCRQRGVKFELLSPGTVKKAVGANVLQKKTKMKTKEAVYACVERYMSEKAKKLPVKHRYDVADAHAIARTAIALQEG